MEIFLPHEFPLTVSFSLPGIASNSNVLLGEHQCEALQWKVFEILGELAAESQLQDQTRSSQDEKPSKPKLKIEWLVRFAIPRLAANGAKGETRRFCIVLRAVKAANKPIGNDAITTERK